MLGRQYNCNTAVVHLLTSPAVHTVATLPWENLNFEYTYDYRRMRRNACYQTLQGYVSLPLVIV